MRYICTHKEFNEPRLDGDSIIITDGVELTGQYKYPVIKADNELEPLKHSYAELYQMYDIFKKDTTSEYITINHYRRYFNPLTEENTVPVPFPMDLRAQYAMCHNIQHLDQCIQIIKKYYPTYNTDNLKVLFPCNMSTQTHEVFNDYCDFIFTILREFHEQNHLHTDADVANYVSNYNNQSIDYQSRLGGFLSERIGTIYFLNHPQNNYKFTRIIPTND